MLACLSGCEMFANHTNPIAGWKPDFSPPPIYQAIEKDYNDYIQTLPPKERQSIGPIVFFEDTSGQHAVEITIGLNGTNWEHVLIYDKDNKRIKIIKYISGHDAS